MTDRLSNTSNTVSIIAPTDEEIDASPYDYPSEWIAREMDALINPDTPLSRAELSRTAADGRFTNKPVAAFDLAVRRYADAVLDSDPNPAKSDDDRREYRSQHVVTHLSVPAGNRPGSALPPSERWDDRTFAHGPVVLAIANGPFYAVALVLRGGGTLYVQSLNFEATQIQLTLV